MLSKEACRKVELLAIRNGPNDPRYSRGGKKSTGIKTAYVDGKIIHPVNHKLEDNYDPDGPYEDLPLIEGEAP